MKHSDPPFFFGAASPQNISRKACPPHEEKGAHEDVYKGTIGEQVYKTIFVDLRPGPMDMVKSTPRVLDFVLLRRWPPGRDIWRSEPAAGAKKITIPPSAVAVASGREIRRTVGPPQTPKYWMPDATRYSDGNIACDNCWATSLQ